MTLTMNPNGRAGRKSLTEQIDRLDSILDGLAEVLNESLASSVKEAVGIAVQEAVRAAVTEVLTNVELHQHLASPSGCNQPETDRIRFGESWVCALHAGWGKVAAIAGRAKAKVGALLSRLGTGMKTVMGRISTRVASVARSTWLRTLFLLSLAKRFRKPVVIALGVGGVVGIGCFFAGPVFGSVVSGLAGFAGSLAVSMLNTLRRVLGVSLVPDA